MKASVQTLDAGLATHRPVEVSFDSWTNLERVKWMPRQQRPNSDILVGPSWNGASVPNWEKLLKEIEQVMPKSHLTYGTHKDSSLFDAKLNQLWNAWQALANDEIRAAFGIDVKHKLGGALDIKEGPLHEAIASTLCHRASSLSAHKWALRNICEARAKSTNFGAPGFVKAHMLAKRYTQLAKLYGEGVLPNGIGIANGLHRYLV